MISKKKFCDIAYDIINLNKRRDVLFSEADRWFNYEPFYEVVSDYVAIEALAAAIEDEYNDVDDWFRESCYGDYSVEFFDGTEVSTPEELYDYIMSKRGKEHE